MPKKHLLCGQGLFSYNFFTGSGDVVPSRNGFSKGIIDIDSATSGITTYKTVEYVQQGLKNTIAVGRRAKDVSQFYAVGGVFSDFHLFPAPHVNFQLNVHLTKSFEVSQETTLTGNLGSMIHATPESIKAFPRLDIVAGENERGKNFKKSPDFLRGTTLNAGDVILNAVAANETAFKIPWNTILTQSSNGDLGVTRAPLSAVKPSVYDEDYYIWYQTIDKFNNVLKDVVGQRNNDGATFLSLKALANKRIGPGGTVVPGTSVTTGVPNTTLKVDNVTQDPFGTMIGDAGIALPGSGPGCFPPGTKISIENKLVNIEDVRPGMKVVSFDPKEGGLFVLNEVKTLLVHKTGEPALEIETVDGDIIQSTFYHKFYHPGFEIYKPIHQFMIGDPLRARRGNTFIKAIKKIESFEIEYNLELIGEPRSYLANGIVVHNIKGAPPMFPKITDGDPPGGPSY